MVATALTGHGEVASLEALLVVPHAREEAVAQHVRRAAALGADGGGARVERRAPARALVVDVQVDADVARVHRGWEDLDDVDGLALDALPELIDQLEMKMKDAAKKLDFEEAANLRDRVKKLRQKLVGQS